MSQNSRPPVSPGMVQVVAGAIIASVLVYAVIGVIFVQVMGANENPILPAAQAPVVGTVLLAAGIAAVVASFLVRRNMESQWPADGPTLQQRMGVIIIALSISDVAGVMGIVYAFLTQTLTMPCVLWGLSLAAGVLHFPSKASLLGK